jgi:hypothetical protein
MQRIGEWLETDPNKKMSLDGIESLLVAKRPPFAASANPDS